MGRMGGEDKTAKCAKMSFTLCRSGKVPLIIIAVSAADFAENRALPSGRWQIHDCEFPSSHQLLIPQKERKNRNPGGGSSSLALRLWGKRFWGFVFCWIGGRCGKCVLAGRILNEEDAWGGWGWELKFGVCLETMKGEKEGGFMGNEQ